MKLLICGSRDWKKRSVIRKNIKEYISYFKSDLCIIEGEANGADKIAREEADKLGIAVLRVPANWDAFGKAAGVVRNGWMRIFGEPDFVLAFHDDIKASKGTKNMIDQARKAQISYAIINSKGEITESQAYES